MTSRTFSGSLARSWIAATNVPRARRRNGFGSSESIRFWPDDGIRKGDLVEDLRRRLEENQRALEAENRKLREEIRRDVVELTLLTAEKVTGKVLDADDQRRLIDETLEDVDVKKIASPNGG